ncbi:MAG: HlyD family secretion protein [Gemmataceae bacterium]
MEPIRPSSPQARRWRLSIPVSLGVLLLLASLVVAAMSLRSHDYPSSAPSSSTVTPIEGQRWNSLGYLDIEGGVTPLYPEQPGRVKSIEARENEPIKAGEPLFHLEDTILVLKVSEAKSDLKGAREKLAIAQARLKQANKQIEAQKTAIAVARKNVAKARLLHDKQKRFAKGGISGDTETVQVAEITVEQAELAVRGEEHKLVLAELAKREVEGYVAVAQANVEAKQAQLKEANNAVEECVVRAPVDGTPLRILVNVGQVLGSNPHQPAIQFAAQRPLLVRAEVEQEFVDHVHKEQSVVIEDHVTGKECARGKVVSLARWYAHRRSASPEMLSMNNDGRTLECLIKIESTSREIRIGQRVRVQFAD